MLRHSLATHLIRRDKSVSDIGLFLRHQHVTTTAVYAKVNIQQLRTAAAPWLGVDDPRLVVCPIGEFHRTRRQCCK